MSVIFFLYIFLLNFYGSSSSHFLLFVCVSLLYFQLFFVRDDLLKKKSNKTTTHIAHTAITVFFYNIILEFSLFMFYCASLKISRIFPIPLFFFFSFFCKTITIFYSPLFCSQSCSCSCVLVKMVNNVYKYVQFTMVVGQSNNWFQFLLSHRPCVLSLCQEFASQFCCLFL